MNKTIKIAILFTLTSLFFISNWLVDVYSNYGYATNGLFTLAEPEYLILAYHLSWYLSIFIFFIVVLWCSKLILGEEE